MIVLTPTKEELKAASFVAHSADLKKVVLLHVSTDGDPREVLRNKAKNAGIEFDLVKYSVVEPGRLNVEISVSVFLGQNEFVEGEKIDPDSTHLQIDTVFLAEYEIPEEPVPAEVGTNALEQFSRLNGITNCWSYVRSEIQHITSSMGLPPFTLPLVTVKAASSQKQAKTEQDC